MDRAARANDRQLVVAVPAPDAAAIQVQVLEEKGLVQLSFAHTPTVPEWTAAMDAALADRGYRAGFGFLVDQRGNRRGLTRLLIGEMVHYLHDHQARIRGARWAVVVDEPAAYGMARACQSLAGGLPLDMAVFQGDTLEKAERWVRRISARNTPRGWVEVVPSRSRVV